MPTLVQDDTSTLVIGNTYVWEHIAERIVDGVAQRWNLTGGTVTIHFKKPDLTSTSFTMSNTDPTNGVHRYTNLAAFLDTAGELIVAFQVSLSGEIKRSLPFSYTVIQSP